MFGAEPSIIGVISNWISKLSLFRSVCLFVHQPWGYFLDVVSLIVSGSSATLLERKGVSLQSSWGGARRGSLYIAAVEEMLPVTACCEAVVFKVSAFSSFFWHLRFFSCSTSSDFLFSAPGVVLQSCHSSASATFKTLYVDLLTALLHKKTLKLVEHCLWRKIAGQKTVTRCCDGSSDDPQLKGPFLQAYAPLRWIFSNSSLCCWSRCKHFKLLFKQRSERSHDPEGCGWELIKCADVVSGGVSGTALCKGKKAPAYSLSRRVMAWRNAGRKLLMVCTSIFNVSFLALSVFCWGQVQAEAPYFMALF